MTGAQRPQRVLVVRCPDWLVAGSSGLADQAAGPAARAFEQVVVAVREFCPQVEVLRPGICAIGVRGPARYFGGEPELAEKIAASVIELGFDCGVGVADGMFAARLAARDTSGEKGAVVIVPPGESPAFLAVLSVVVLGEPELTDLLVRLGIRTLSEFAALPAEAARDRFGAAGLIAHRLASGLDPRPLAPKPAGLDLSVLAEFDPPVGQSERVVFTAKSLAAQMHDRLAAAGLACIRMQVQVICSDGQEITRLWRHDGLLSELAVAERVRWQLDGWRAGRSGDGTGPDDGIEAAGISLLRLIPDQLVHDRGRQLGLWGDAVVTDRVARAAVRVQAMLGHDAVRYPVPAGGRHPAEQMLPVPFGDVQQPRRPAERPWPGTIPAPAPATVYPAPRPAQVTDETGALVTVTGRGHLSATPHRLSLTGEPPMAITAWTGPWPVNERWWDPEHACRKARFQLVTVDGAAWLAVVQDGRWLIEAAYD